MSNDDRGDPKPASVDGREIDPARGELSGEGSGQLVRSDRIGQPDRGVPARASFSTGPSPTYYGQPAIKPHVWKGYIPLYFYVGGTAGALSALGATALVFGGGKLDLLRGRSRWLGLGGDVLSSVLLVADLGRPARFLNMLRVFRPTSPMNLGTWVLSGSGAMNSASALFEDSVVGRVGELGAGLLGLPLAGYTAVLLANTAVPAWQHANRTLPALFVASSIASAASLLELARLDPPSQRAVKVFGTLGRASALVASDAVERSLARSPAVGRTLTTGRPGSLWTAARVLTAASLGLSLFGGKRRWAQTAAGVLGTAGSLAMRFAVVEAGKASALEPRATFEAQRAGLGAAEVLGTTRDPQTGAVIGAKLKVL